MGLFSKRAKTLVPSEVLAQLNSFGNVAWESTFNSQPMNDPRFEWGNFFSKVIPAYQTDFARAVTELHEAAGSDQLAQYGAYRIIFEFEPASKEPLYLELMDAALRMMHDNRLSSGHMTGYERERWVATHGDVRSSFDGIVEVASPPPGSSNLTLAPGGTLMVAMMGPGQLDNQFWIECTEIGTYRTFSMRPQDNESTELTYCQEQSVGEYDDADGILRALGSYLGRPTYWAHDELDPYFTERRKA